ncbi:polyphosphate kinase 1 [Dyadobacter sp. CY107]|uniref:polyphosphate kinase 1 n=1 Tax=Dyadobacter fanqingshengii TaxID=2906443 RepID=UPI001F164059|nr:polyphosphate kinase 1 [Dyadobacter fanqingshengii]MCF2502988.1 polyphosphate kinase 1 [Dyadobacter fanqingshengii]
MSGSTDPIYSNGKKGRLNNLFAFFKSTKGSASPEDQKIISPSSEKANTLVQQSDLISRDLSWLKFNDRVLDQATNEERNLFDRLKFLAITSSNLDEFFTIRVGSLYNYLDFGKERLDYSGLREIPFRKVLMRELHEFVRKQNDCYKNQLLPLFEQHGFKIIKVDDVHDDEKAAVEEYFERTVYPMLTPMLFDYTHAFPVLLAKVLILGVITQVKGTTAEEDRKLSFVQLPLNLPRFYVIDREDELLFLPIEDIVRAYIHKLYRNVDIVSTNLFRIIRNGDFSLEESDDVEADFIDEIKQKIKSRRLGRVVQVSIEHDTNPDLLSLIKKRWEIDDYNVFPIDGFIDYTSFWGIIKHPEFKDQIPAIHPPVPPLGLDRERIPDIFEVMRERDILLHHPYNNFEPVLQLLEQAAEDPKVLSIKLTIYRLAKNSRVTEALLHAAENGKHVAVLFEVKARFDEENNIREAQRLQKAGCFVIYGIGLLKTHTKLLLIVRNEGNRVLRYAHLSSGNYNEDTSRLYTDTGLLTSNEEYTHDISEFFNVITGHSIPSEYQNLITAPRYMRDKLVDLIQQEAENARAGLKSGICIKINSLEDRTTILELYKASQAGVPIKLIVRGMCCLRPQRAGLSENITVRSLVGDFLEHSRIFYFHQNGDPLVYGGSADAMVRSFDKRIESLFKLVDPRVRQEAIHILYYSLQDNVNAYEMHEDGSYVKCEILDGTEPLNVHEAFYSVTLDQVMATHLFEDEPVHATASETIESVDSEELTETRNETQV